MGRGREREREKILKAFDKIAMMRHLHSTDKKSRYNWEKETTNLTMSTGSSYKHHTYHGRVKNIEGESYMPYWCKTQNYTYSEWDGCAKMERERERGRNTERRKWEENKNGRIKGIRWNVLYENEVPQRSYCQYPKQVSTFNRTEIKYQ